MASGHYDIDEGFFVATQEGVYQSFMAGNSLLNIIPLARILNLKKMKAQIELALISHQQIIFPNLSIREAKGRYSKYKKW